MVCHQMASSCEQVGSVMQLEPVLVEELSAPSQGAGLSDRVEDISAELVSRGFSYSGKDWLTSGITGARMAAPFRLSFLLVPLYSL